MKKIRFKTRNGVLYFGFDGKFKSSGLKDTKINRNIVASKFKRGEFNKEFNLFDNRNSKTIAELLDEVMITKSKTLKRKTMITYQMTCKNWIIPYFKDLLVSQVRPLDIKKFQDMLIDNGLGRFSINTARGLLKEVFDLAVIDATITTNPITVMPFPKIKSKKYKQKPCSLDEIDLILKYEKGEMGNFLGISFFTGMRSGELLALKWEDVDFNTDTLSISKTISAGFINEAKTESSVRDIEMIPQAREFFKKQQLITGLKNSYVFLNNKNTYYYSNATFNSRFKNILKELKLEERSLHNTRHTFASVMLNNNIEVLWVSNMLGHSDLTITLNTYTHYMPKKEKMKLNFLEKRYKNGTDNE